MEITAKGRYAVRICADIARSGEEYVSIADIAERQQISVKYIEKIMSMLAKAKIVKSMRGAYGGYKLARSKDKISVKEILSATGDGLEVASCVASKDCPNANSCDTIGVWNALNSLINNFLGSVTLQDLVDKTCEKNIKKS